MRNALFLVLFAACGQPATGPGGPAAPSNAAPAKPLAAPGAGPASMLAWPVAPFTKAQIAEVKACDIGSLATKRYPAATTIDALPAAFAVHGTCDQATLAAACATRVGDAAPPQACLDAFHAALQANPGFAFANELIGAFFGKVSLVAAPDVARHALASVTIDYAWSGLGTGVKWSLAATELATHPTIAATGPDAKPVKWSADLTPLVAAFGTSLTGFLPIPKLLQAVDCTDNYPEWTATLTFDDGTKLELSTQGSNLLGLGGPWQMTIGGVAYLQLQPDFVRAIDALVQKLKLPIGEPEGAFCRGYDLEAEVLVD